METSFLQTLIARFRAPALMIGVSLVGLAGCIHDTNEADETAARDVAIAANQQQVAVQAQAPAGLANLTQFTVVNQNGVTVGTYRNIGGTTWTGPDPFDGGDIQWTEIIRRDDEVKLASPMLGDWQGFVVVRPSGGARIYRESVDNQIVDGGGLSSTDLEFL